MKKKMMVFEQTQDTAIQRDLLEDVRQKLLSCIQCGTCTGSCPNAAAMDMTPRQLWRRVVLNQTEEVFNSRTFSLCSACYCCTLRCPRELPLTEIMAQLKQIALQQGWVQGQKSTLFYQCFLESVRRHGRVKESEFMLLYFLALKNPLLPIQHAPLAWQLMRKGKIHIEFPSRGNGNLDPLFRAVERMEGRQ